MKRKTIIFILINLIIITFLWLCSTWGKDNINTISFILALVLSLGGEFIISCIFSFRIQYDMGFQTYLFSVIINFVVLTISCSTIYDVFIYSFCMNQLLGFTFGNTILKEIS